MKSNNYLFALPVVALLIVMSICFLFIHFIEWSSIGNMELRFHLIVLIFSIAEYVLYLKTKS